MRVIKDRKVVDDQWRLVADDEAVPAGGHAIVGLARWNRDAEALASGPRPIGIVVRSSEGAEDIRDLEHLDLVAVDFPAFTDGRGYTTARLLRSRYGYRGEIRAVGDVLRDQLLLMKRCGIDSFALKAGKDIEGALAAFDDFSVTYQAAADDERPLFRRVHR